MTDPTDVETVARLRWSLARCQPIPEDLAADIYSTVWELLTYDERMYVTVNSTDHWDVVPSNVREVMILMAGTSTRTQWRHYSC